MLEQLWRLSERVQPGESAWRLGQDSAGDELDRLIEARLLGLAALTPQDVRRRGADPDDARLIRLDRLDRPDRPDPPVPLPGAAAEFQFPAFQFAPAGGPWDVVMEVNQLLDAADDPWGVTCWWVDPHARLGDAPADLLGRGQDGLIMRAARALAGGY
jgi:hypothetical protein